MNNKEKSLFEGMIEDMEHDLKQYRSWRNSNGGINQECFELRYELKIKDLKNLLLGVIEN